ncbi:MAG: hypothetical protein IKR15_02205 [Bacteroidales bacterium]|nr:hypothetical protein [Bacteroidales bacterium]
MTDDIIIDGVNIRTAYSVTLGEDSYKSLIQWPEMKSVDGNDWQEMNGYEPDLSNPLLESRNLALNFILKGNVGQIDTFYALLGSKPTHLFEFEVGRTLTLRLLSMPSVKYARTFHVLQVQFAADIPLEGYVYAAPSSSLPQNNEYVIDGMTFSDFGVRITQGTISSVIKGADVKPLLIRKSSVISGAKYDENPLLNDADNSFDSEEYETIGGTVEGVSANWKRSKARGSVTYKGRDITLNCQMDGAKTNVWRNYDALLYFLTKTAESPADPTLAGARIINIRALGKTFKCFYKSQTVEEFLYDGRTIWAKFNLTLTLFEEEGSASFFLATEDGGFVITEDGKLIPILPAL